MFWNKLRTPISLISQVNLTIWSEPKTAENSLHPALLIILIHRPVHQKSPATDLILTYHTPTTQQWNWLIGQIYVKGQCITGIGQKFYHLSQQAGIYHMPHQNINLKTHHKTIHYRTVILSLFASNFSIIMVTNYIC